MCLTFLLARSGPWTAVPASGKHQGSVCHRWDQAQLAAVCTTFGAHHKVLKVGAPRYASAGRGLILYACCCLSAQRERCSNLLLCS